MATGRQGQRWPLLLWSLALPMLLGFTPCIANTADGPPREAVQGSPVSFVLTTVDFNLFRGTVFYRPIGASVYQQLPLQVQAGGAVSVDFPAAVVVMPGLEYYIQLVDASGNISHFPYSADADHPRVLRVVSPPVVKAVKLVSPDISLPLDEERLSFVFEVMTGDAFSGDSFSLLLDETDVTALASINGNRISLPLPFSPESGSHDVTMRITDAHGSEYEKTWSFEVADELVNEVYSQGGVTFNYGRQLDSNNGASTTAMSGNLNAGFGVKHEAWEATWDGFNLQYVKDDPGDDLTLNSGFNFTARRGEQMVEYGDITIKETPLTAPSFARRGVQAQLRNAETELRLFNVSAQSVRGWSSGIGKQGNQVYGASIRMPLLPDGGLPFTATYIKGQNEAVDGFNASSNQQPSKGDVFGINFKHRMSSTSLDIELASSRYDSDTTDTRGAQQDVAAAVSLSSSVGRYTLGVGNYYYGPDFASIANPHFTSDRYGYFGRVATDFGPSSLSFSLNRDRDNVKTDASRPVVYNTTGTISYGIASVSWPSLNLSYSRSQRESQSVPASSPPVKNTNESINGGLSFSRGEWFANLSTNYGKLNDQIGNLDSSTRGVSLSASYAGQDGINVSPSLSVNTSRSAGVLKTTRIATLSAKTPFWWRHTDSSFQISLTEEHASDGSPDSRITNGSWRLSFDLRPFLKGWASRVTPSLGLTANYSRTDGVAAPGASRGEYSIYLNFNLFAPVDYSRGF